MPVDERPPSFQFYPQDYLADPAVGAMTPEQRGGYVHLLCYAFGQPEPGVLPDDDPLLARLSDLRERWPECRTAIRSAFRTATRDGAPVLVQRRMVADRKKQKERFEQASKGARITNEKRWGSVAQRQDSERTATRTAVTPSSSSSSSSETESKSTPPLPPVARARAAPSPVGREHPRFAEWYEAYPRHKGRQHASLAYARSMRDGVDPMILLSASARYKNDCAGLDPSKVKHPATWLNGKCWLDEPDKPTIAVVPQRKKLPEKPLFTEEEMRPPNEEERAKVAALLSDVTAKIGR